MSVYSSLIWKCGLDWTGWVQGLRVGSVIMNLMLCLIRQFYWNVHHCLCLLSQTTRHGVSTPKFASSSVPAYVRLAYSVCWRAVITVLKLLFVIITPTKIRSLVLDMGYLDFFHGFFTFLPDKCQDRTSISSRLLFQFLCSPMTLNCLRRCIVLTYW